MKDLRTKVTNLRKKLERAIAVEANLAATLRSQEHALRRGAAEQVMDASSALNDVYGELREVSNQCRKAVALLHSDLGLAEGAPLREIIERLPGDLAPQVQEQRVRLEAARNEASLLSTRNATIARSSLDAIASIRGFLTRALQGPEEAAESTQPLSRLDARA